MIIGVLLAGCLGLVVWFFLSTRPEPQPDVAKAARSASARAADQALTARMDDRMDQVRGALPWATYLGTTVADVCSTHSATASFMARQTWTPVTCTRTSTVYEAFDGDFKQRLSQLDAALGAAGWRPEWGGMPNKAGQEPGLVAAFDYAHQPPGDPSPSEVAEAAARPNMVNLEYTVPSTADFVLPSGRSRYFRSGGTVDVVQAPHLPTLDDGTALHDIALKYPSDKTSYYVDWKQYSRPQLEAAAYPAYDAILAISISEPYNTSPARP